MCRRLARTFVVLTGIVVIAGCTHHVAVSHAAISHSDLRSVHQPTAEQRALGIYQPYSDADVEFMTGMIPHHAQAVVMAGWAPSHGARSDVTILCERIVVGQND